MKIKDNIFAIKAEIISQRTPKGWPINEFALDNLIATLEDKKNYNQPVMNCINCGIIISGLLVPSGCPNCGYKQNPD